MPNKLLIVDDSQFIHAAIKNAIADYYDLHFETSGESALSYLASNNPDLILLDVNMSGMNGYETLIQIRKAGTDVPTIFLTVDTSIEAELKALEAGAVDFISKPFNPQQLKKRIDMFLELIFTKKELEKKLKELEASEERYRLATDLSDSVIFEFTFHNQTISFSDNYAKYFEGEAIIENFPQSLITTGFVFENDIRTFLRFYDKLKRGEELFNCELRLCTKNKEYLWYRVRGSTLFDKDNMPKSAIGSISNIDIEKKESQKLTEKAQKDSLTHLYNKATTQNIIEASMMNSQRDQLGALIIIDVDNFKSVNDNLGHFVGDAVLVEIAKKLTENFRTTDVVGRIGGDEFLVYMNNVPSKDIVYKKAQSVLKAIKKSFFAGDNKEYAISGSLGIAYFPFDEDTYEELFKKADSTLYIAKRLGKDRFCVYEDYAETKSSIKEDFPLPQRTQTDTDSSSSYIGFKNSDIVYSIFEMLYESKDTHASILLILEILSDSFDFKRAYIFKNYNDGVKKTCEWCAKNVNALESSHFEASLQPYYDYFSEYGLFLIDDANTPNDGLRNYLKQNCVARSVQCAIIHETNVTGYLGFDFFEEDALLSSDKLHKLTFIGKLISIFVSNTDH